VRLARSAIGLVPWVALALQIRLLEHWLRQRGQTLLARELLEARIQQLELQAAATLGRSEPAPFASRPAQGSAFHSALFAPYQRLQDRALQSVPAYPTGRFDGSGIVMLAGGPRFFTSAWVGLWVLRRVLNCRLPVQVWYLGAGEMSASMIRILEELDVECVDALEVQRTYPTSAMGGWELKPYVMLHSRFEELIYIDADVVPLADPSYLFQSSEYRESGAIFRPGMDTLPAEHPIWEICRVAYREEPDFESGQLVLDKERCWRALHLALHLNEESDFYYRYVNGDKETFHLAWRMLDQPYGMPSKRPAWVTGLINPDDTNFADVLIQHDFAGTPIFQHRTGAKWNAWGKPFHVPGFPYEDACFEALRELRARWDGRIEISAAPSYVESEARIVRARYFLYRVVGASERVLTLQPGGRIDDGKALWERRWRLEDGPDGPGLLLEGKAGTTCRLREEAGGVWRGRCLHHERAPVELVPLGLERSGSIQSRASEAGGSTMRDSIT
jgi:hypothetical protein